MGHNRVRPKYVQAERAVISSGIPVASARGMSTGNLAPVEAKGLAVMGQIDDFSPVLLAFAWAKSNDPPLILGQLNFFIEFDVCFYRSQLAFDIFPKRSPKSQRVAS